MTAATVANGSARTVGTVVTLSATLALAVNNMAMPFVYKAGWNAQSVVLVRFVFATIVLAMALSIAGRVLKLARADLGHSIVSGVLVAMGAFGLLGSFQYIPVSLAIVIVYTNPVLTAVMLSLWHRHAPNVTQIVCLVVAFAGVAIATGIDSTSLDPRGIAFAIMSSISFALSFAWNSAKLRRADAMVVTLYMVMAGGVAAAAYVFASQSLQVSGELRGWLLFLIPACCFTFGMIGMYEGVKRIGGAAAAMLMNLEPVLTIALAPFVLGERLTPAHIIGGILVISAVIVSDRWGSNATEAVP